MPKELFLKWVAIEERIKNLDPKKEKGGVLGDGIINSEQWLSQAIRPLFIGKEAYHDGGEPFDSFTECIGRNPVLHCRVSPKSWKKTAYISYGLQKGVWEYDKLPKFESSPAIAECLRSIAFINTSKIKGQPTTSAKRLEYLFKENRDILLDQIEHYQPNVIIGWKTLLLYEQDPEFKRRFMDKPDYSVGKTHYGYNRFWTAGGKLFIAANHPAHRRTKSLEGLTEERYVGDILRIVRENLDKLDRTRLMA